MTEDYYHPSFFFRNPHLQSILASSRLRAGGTEVFHKASAPKIINTKLGTRLLGYYTPSLSPKTKRGYVLLLPGWEGSESSAYMLSLGKYLSLKGYPLFRLNYRDHGESHHLNEGLFHGALIEEVENAVAEVAREKEELPFYIVGFSLGGNFALRIARRQSMMSRTIPNLRHVFAVSPPLDPLKATILLDQGPAIYRYYFMKKWKRSLRKKQTLYPHLYNFKPLFRHRTCLGLTEAIMPYFPEFPDYKSYFSLYTLKGDFFSKINIPTTVIVSDDDPVVVAEDFNTIPPSPYISLYRFRYGGHCGFFENFSLCSWYEKKICETIERLSEDGND